MQNHISIRDEVVFCPTQTLPQPPFSRQSCLSPLFQLTPHYHFMAAAPRRTNGNYLTNCSLVFCHHLGPTRTCEWQRTHLNVCCCASTPLLLRPSPRSTDSATLMSFDLTVCMAGDRLWETSTFSAMITLIWRTDRLNGRLRCATAWKRRSWQRVSQCILHGYKWSVNEPDSAYSRSKTSRIRTFICIYIFTMTMVATAGLAVSKKI